MKWIEGQWTERISHFNPLVEWTTFLSFLPHWSQSKKETSPSSSSLTCRRWTRWSNLLFQRISFLCLRDFRCFADGNSSCFSTSSRWKEEIQRRRNRSARQKCFIRIGHSSEQCSTNSFVQQWSIYSLLFNSLIHRLIIVQHCTLRSFHFSQFVQHFLFSDGFDTALLWRE